jgi:uncharacterized protein
VSLLDAKGRPSITERAFVLPPGSQLGPITDDQRQALIAESVVAGVYEKTVDRESAYEKLKERAESAQPATVPATKGRASAGGRGAPPASTADAGTAGDVGSDVLGGLRDAIFGSTGPRGGRREGMAETMAKSAVRSIGSAVGREIIRGVLGGIMGSKRR